MSILQAANITNTITDAFSHPFPLDQMIRITFIVGAGKLSRQKYDAKATQNVTSALRKLDFNEDRGASCVNECAGTYKTQHDTGKNIFTVVVFPRMVGAAGEKGMQGNEEEGEERLIPVNSPGYKIAVSSQQTFQNLLSTYCPTYLEKRECLGCLEGLLQVENAIEEKLMKGLPLDSAEQRFYDETSELKEKHAYAQKEASKHVEDGRLTLEEKNILVEMNERRIETLMNEKSSASVAEKLKKAMARKKTLQSLTGEVLAAESSSYPPPLRYEPQINALRKKLLPLQALEGSSKGRLLTLKETRSLTEKEEMEGEITRLEEASCGWFEEEDAFQTRLERSRERFDAKFSRSKKGGGGAGMRVAGKGSGGSSSSPAKSKWILPGQKQQSAWGASSKKGKLKGKGGAVFTAMMMDSSSDEEEEESDEENVEIVTEEKKSYATTQKERHPAVSNILAPKKAAAAASSSSSAEKSGGTENDSNATQPWKAKKSKKKKKKKSKSTQSEGIWDETENEATAVEVNGTQSTKKNDTQSLVSDSLLAFWRSFLLPLIKVIVSLLMSLLTSLFTMITGKKSKKGGKKKRG